MCVEGYERAKLIGVPERAYGYVHKEAVSIRSSAHGSHRMNNSGVHILYRCRGSVEFLGVFVCGR